MGRTSPVNRGAAWDAIPSLCPPRTRSLAKEHLHLSTAGARIDVHVLPDRIEAILVGKEPDRETVAAAFDWAVYGGQELSMSQAMN